MTRTAPAAVAVLAAVLAAPAVRAAPSNPVFPGVTERVSVSSTGAQSSGPVDEGSGRVAISGNGRIATFTSDAIGLVHACGLGDTPLGPQVYARDLATGVTELVSVTTKGCPWRAGGWLTSSVSRDGRYVAFNAGGTAPDDSATYRQEIVPGFHPDAGTDAVYVRDRLRKRTVAVSVGYDGRPNNADAQFPAISGNGRYVVFESGASNIVRGDPLGKGDNLVQDLYVRDLQTGRTERVGSAHPRAHRFEKVNASISDDGRWITFETADAALFATTDYGPYFWTPTHFPDGSGPTQIFLYDRITKRTTHISRNPTEGWAGNYDSDLGTFRRAGNHTISGDGRYVVFASHANNLLPGEPYATFRNFQADNMADIYLYDRITRGLTRVTTGPGGLPGDGLSANPAISADGRWVTFATLATNLGDVDLTPATTSTQTGPETESGMDVYRWDRTTGTHQIMSRSTEGVQGSLDSVSPAISGDGKLVAFSSYSPNLVTGDTNSQIDVFLRRMS